MGKDKKEDQTRWLRICGGDCCPQCAELAGRFFKREDKAKRLLHPKCQCTAEEVPYCLKEGGFEAGDLLVSVLSYSADLSGDYTFSVWVTNTASVAITGVQVQVVVHAGNSEISDETYDIGELEPDQGETIEGSGHVNGKEAIKAFVKGLSVWAEGSYSKNGEKQEVEGGCWYK